MKDFAKMMKQAQQMQKNMKLLQDQLDGVEMEGSAGGGMVTVTMSGKVEVRRVTISDAAMEDKETLEDLIAAAFNDAHNKVQNHVNGEMQKMSGGLGGMLGM